MRKFLFLLCLPLMPMNYSHAADTLSQPSQMPLQINQHESGKEWFASVLKEFQEGKDAHFLTELNQRYVLGLKQGDWDRLIEERKTINEQLQTPEGKEQFEKLKLLADAFVVDLLALQKGIKNQLAKVALEYPQDPVSSIIREYTSFPALTADQQAAQEYVARLQYPLTEDNQNLFETQLRDIAQEYKIKKFLLYLASTDHASSLGLQPIEKNAKEKYFTILHLQEMQTMLGISKKNHQTALASKIELALSTYASTAAEKHDLDYLESFADGTRTASSPAEKKVAEIMKNYKTEQQGIFEKYLSLK